MNLFGRHVVSFLAGLASAYTLSRHILPVDIRYHNGVVLAFVIFNGLLFHYLYPREISILQRGMEKWSVVRRYSYMVIGLLLTVGLVCWLGNQYPLRKIDMQIMATGHKNMAAQGNEVWLKGVYIDGEQLDMTSFEVDYHGWEMLKNAWIATHNQPTLLRWKGLAGKEIRLVLGKHPYSGEVTVVALGKTYELDLYGTENTVEELIIPVYNPIYATKQGELITYIIDFMTSGLLVFILLVLVSRGVNQEQVIGANCLKQRVYRRWLLGSASALVCGGVVILLFNYMIDPLQFYRRAPYTPYWSKEQRYQNPGLAKNYSYDTVLMGTSTIENYIPAQVDEWLGSKSVKLAISGSTLREQMLTLQLALATKQVKRVIWGMDYMALGRSAQQIETGPGAFPLYLYQASFLGSLPYLFSNTTTQQSLEIVIDKLRLSPYHTSQLSFLNAWQHQVVFGSEFVQRHFKQIQRADFGDNQILRRLYNGNNYIFKDFKDNIDINIAPLIAEQPQVHFDLFFPPYHVLFLTAFYQQNPQTIRDWLVTRQYLVERLAPYPNVTIHDFQGDEAYVLDDRRYKDVLHYDKETGDQLIRQIKMNSHVVDQGKMENCNQQLLKLIQRGAR